MTNDCKTCPVSTGTHQPAEALHQIAEPDAQHLQELAAYRFTVDNLRARVAELEARLEIDYRHPYDGIAARDATIKAQDERIAELESQLEAIGAGGVEPLRKPAAQAVHQIAEPAAPVGKPIEDAIDALVWAAFTEGGCSEHRMSEARIQTELRKKELCTLLSTPQPCCRSHPHEEMTPMCELRTEIARLTNALARAEAQLAAAPQAVQADAPVVLGWVRRGKTGLIGNHFYTYEPHCDAAVRDDGGEKIAVIAAHAHPAEGVPVQPGKPLRDLALGVTSFLDHAGFDTSHLPSGMGAALRRLRDAAIATQPAAQGMEADLTDEQIDEAFNQMPDGAAGFLKSWGYRQFARAVLAAQAKQGGAA